MGSFGREIKDFIAAFQAGEKIMGSRDDDEYKRLRNQALKTKMSPERLKLDDDYRRAQTERLRRGPQVRPMHPSQQRALDARTDYYKALQEGLKNPPRAPSAVDDAGDSGYAPPSGGKSLGPQSAVPVDDEPIQSAELFQDDYEDEGDVTQLAARGGMIRRPSYAEGGAVEEPDYEDDEADVVDYADDDMDEDAGAVPTGPVADPQTAPAPAPQTQSPGYSAQAAHDAALEGIKYARKNLGMDGDGALEVSSQARSTGMRAYLQRQGAMQQSEMNEVRKAIDPKNQMSESERNMAALAHVYEYNLKQNNPQGAARAAASMTQYFGQISGRYQALAKVAAESGDVDGAVKAMLKAHANIPDGTDFRVFKRGDGSYGYSYVETQSGNVMERGIASPEQILQFATNGAARSMEDFIVSASGTRAGNKPTGRAAAAPNKGEPVPKLDDHNDALKVIDEAVTSSGAKIKKFEPEIKHLAAQIRLGNSVTGQTALEVVGELTDEKTTGFKPEKTDSGYLVTLSSGRQVRLSRDAFQNINALRARMKTATPAASPAASSAAPPPVEGPEKPRDPRKGWLPSQKGPAPYGNPLQELRDSGRVSGRQAVPTEEPMSEIDQINAARRSQGLPPIREDQLPR